MSAIAPKSMRQACRLCSRRPSSLKPTSTLQAQIKSLPSQRRNYVSETKPDNATVNIDTAIKADQKSFIEQTGKRPQDVTMPSTQMSADTMMSPAAGMFLEILPIRWCASNIC